MLLWSKYYKLKLYCNYVRNNNNNNNKKKKKALVAMYHKTINKIKYYTWPITTHNKIIVRFCYFHKFSLKKMVTTSNTSEIKSSNFIFFNTDWARAHHQVVLHIQICFILLLNKLKPVHKLFDQLILFPYI